MADITQSEKGLLRHLANGGLCALAVYGKTTKTMEALSQPRCLDAGLNRFDSIVSKGLARYGYPSPYKNGKSIPIVLTEAGKAAEAEDANV